MLLVISEEAPIKASISDLWRPTKGNGEYFCIAIEYMTNINIYANMKN